MENGSDYNQTITFSISSENEAETRNILRQVYDALLEKGYNPINQLAGYILSEDPTYITNYKGARGLIRRMERDELLEVIVRDYCERLAQE